MNPNYLCMQIHIWRYYTQIKKAVGKVKDTNISSSLISYENIIIIIISIVTIIVVIATIISNNCNNNNKNTCGSLQFKLTK